LQKWTFGKKDSQSSGRMKLILSSEQAKQRFTFVLGDEEDEVKSSGKMTSVSNLLKAQTC